MDWQSLVIWAVSISEKISQGSIITEDKTEVYHRESHGVNVWGRALRTEGDTGLYLLITFV